MTTQPLREVIGSLTASATAVSAVGAALNAMATGIAIPSAVRPALEEVLDALGVRERVQELSPEAIRPILGEMRTALLAAAARISSDAPSVGWKPDDPRMLQAAGDVSAGFPALLGRFAPLLDGLSTRLQGDGACFLDVGVGVAALAIEMARLWPTLRIVGIDVWAPSLALARQNVKQAGLDHRIELRDQDVQDLGDEAIFDLAWIPSAFIPRPVIPAAIQRVRRALRPGGWLLFAALTTGPDPLSASLVRLRAAEWGSSPWPPAEVEQLLQHNGFCAVRTLPTPPGSVGAFVAARTG
jgi:SAM-dependent methyltransferase